MDDSTGRTERLRAFARGYLRDEGIEDEHDFFADCGASSMFALQLVLFIEEEFGLEVDDEDLELENFRSIGALGRLVERKLRSASV